MSNFTDEQREQITQALVEAGRELVLQYGPAKTTLADITDAVGIPTSSFYLFFDSKDELYLEIVHREILAFQDRLEEGLEDETDPTRGLLHLFRSYADFADDNPLVQQLIIQNDRREAFQTSLPEKLEAVQRERMETFVQYVETIQEMGGGALSELPPEMVIGVLSTLGLLALHKEEYTFYYSDEYYYDLQDLLIRALATGLTELEP